LRVFGAWLFDAQLFHSGSEGTGVDRQALGRPVTTGDPPVGFLQDLPDMICFDVFQPTGMAVAAVDSIMPLKCAIDTENVILRNDHRPFYSSPDI
jgi:hypothetical protein